VSIELEMLAIASQHRYVNATQHVSRLIHVIIVHRLQFASIRISNCNTFIERLISSYLYIW